MTRLHPFKPHLVLAALLAVALLWAYALTQPQWWPQGDADKPIPVWTLDFKEIDRVEYNEGANHIVIRSDPGQRLQDGSAALWVEAEGPTAAPDTQPPRPLPGKPPVPGKPSARPGTPPRPGAPPSAKPIPPGPHSSVPAPSASTAAGATTSNPAVVEHASFRGGAAANNALRELSRLAGLRDLGRANAKQLQAFGLDKPLGTLRIVKAVSGSESRSAPAPRADAPPVEASPADVLRLDLGLVSQSGATRYVALQPSGRVFLVSMGFFRQMEHIRRIMDREWVPFNLMEAQRLEVRTGTHTLTAWHLDVPPTQPQRWAFKRDATQGDPVAQALAQTISGMKVLEYVGLSGQPGRTDTVLEVTAYRAAPKAAPGGSAPPPASPDEPVTLRVFKAGGKPGTDMRAVSEYTTVPISLSEASVKAVLDRARPLLEGK